MAGRHRSGGFLPIRILPESINFFYDRAHARSVRWLLRMARWPGGVERLFLSRLPDSDPKRTTFLLARRSSLDELAMLHFLLNRPPRRDGFRMVGDPVPPFTPPHDVSGMGARLASETGIRRSLAAAFLNSEHPCENVWIIPDTGSRGRLELGEMPDNVAGDYANMLVPVSITSDALCQDILGRSDVWVNPGAVLHPPSSAEERPHFSTVVRLALQKGMPVLSTHLLSIALFELRLDHKPFRPDKIESRFHDLGRRMRRLDFPHDHRLEHVEFRRSRVARFIRRFEEWFYTVDSKLFFHTRRFPELAQGRQMNYLYYADLASHLFYEFGLNRTDLDQFMKREEKALVVVR